MGRKTVSCGKITIMSVSLGFEKLNNFLAAGTWLLHELSYFNTTYTNISRYFTFWFIICFSKLLSICTIATQ